MMVLDVPLVVMAIKPVTDSRRAVERLIREVWVPYMHGHGGAKPTGYPKQASGGARNFTSLDLDNVEAYERLDRSIGDRIDAAIRDLSPVEQCGVHHAYLYAVYRFREPLEDVLDRAMMKLEIGLRARNVWLG